MKAFSSLFAILLSVLASSSAFAAAPSTTSSSSSSYPTSSVPYDAHAPDYIAAALGDYDFDKGGNRNSADYRIEYQWGMSLVPMINHDWAYLNRWFQVHPVAGFEGDGNGMTFFNGGLDVDVPIVSRLMFTWGETAGWYGHGDDHQTLGSPFEIRSQLELGWKFENEMRLSGYISHTSNAGIGDHDPGAETLGAYLRVPVSWLAR